jgi:hypothetical protein
MLGVQLKKFRQKRDYHCWTNDKTYPRKDPMKWESIRDPEGDDAPIWKLTTLISAVT